MTTRSRTSPPEWTAVEVAFPTDSRLPRLLEMVESLSRAQTPFEVLRVFRDGFPRLTRTDGYISLSTRDLPDAQYRITRSFLSAEELRSGTPLDVWSNISSIPVNSGGLLGSVITRGVPLVLRNLDVQHDPVLEDSLAGFGSLMAIPLYDDGLVKNWAIVLSQEREGYGLSEVEEALVQANLVGGTVKRAWLGIQLLEAKERDAAEIDRIGRIQRALLPREAPNIEGVQFARAYETFDRAGGDLYQFKEFEWTDPLDGSTASGVGMFVADASGHGPAAAVVAAMSTAIFQSIPRRVEGASEVLARLNEPLSATPIEGSFTTAFIGLFDPRTQRLVHASAGHPYPLLRRADHSITRLDPAGGLPLGIASDSIYEQAVLQLEPGATLAIYTDGITETKAPDGKMFGEAGVERALHECEGDADCALEIIMSAVRAFEDGVRPSDDQTLIVVQVH